MSSNQKFLRQAIVVIPALVFAAAIAWSFSLWKEVLAAESGSMGKILTLEPGYSLWVSSFTLLTIGTNYYHFLFRTKATA